MAVNYAFFKFNISTVQKFFENQKHLLKQADLQLLKINFCWMQKSCLIIPLLYRLIITLSIL